MSTVREERYASHFHFLGCARSFGIPGNYFRRLISGGRPIIIAPVEFSALLRRYCEISSRSRGNYSVTFCIIVVLTKQLSRQRYESFSLLVHKRTTRWNIYFWLDCAFMWATKMIKLQTVDLLHMSSRVTFSVKKLSRSSKITRIPVIMKQARIGLSRHELLLRFVDRVSLLLHILWELPNRSRRRVRCFYEK